MLRRRQGRGLGAHRTRNQVQIVCVIKCNEYSQVTLATHHLTHPFITARILFYLCSLDFVIYLSDPRLDKLNLFSIIV